MRFWGFTNSASKTFVQKSTIWLTWMTSMTCKTWLCRQQGTASNPSATGTKQFILKITWNSLSQLEIIPGIRVIMEVFEADIGGKMKYFGSWRGGDRPKWHYFHYFIEKSYFYTILPCFDQILITNKQNFLNFSCFQQIFQTNKYTKLIKVREIHFNLTSLKIFQLERWGLINSWIFSINFWLQVFWFLPYILPNLWLIVKF